MQIEKLKAQAMEVADTIRSSYDNSKYNSNFTLWDIANQDNGNPSDRFALVDYLLAGKHLRNHLPLPPKSSAPTEHYSTLCLQNRDMIEPRFRDLLGGFKDDIDKTMDIVSDKRLFNEAVALYVKFGGKLKVNLFDFLLHYDLKSGEMHKRDKFGNYEPVASRMIHRYGTIGLEESLYILLPDPVCQQVIALDINAQISQVSPGLRNMHAKLITENKRKTDKTKRIRVLEGILTKRRAKPTQESIDWAEIEKERRSKLSPYEAYSAKEAAQGRILKKLGKDYLAVFEIEGNAVLERIERDRDEEIKEISEADQKDVREVYELVLQEFQLICSFDKLQTVNKTASFPKVTE